MKKQQKLFAAHANDFAIAGIQNSSKAQASPNNNNQVCDWCCSAHDIEMTRNDWIDTPTSSRQPGVVQHSHHTPRSYVVKTEFSTCSSLRRNRRHITPLPSQSNDQISPSPASFDERDAGKLILYMTRYGRKVVPPKRLQM